MEKRINQVNELIRSELAKIIAKTIEFPFNTIHTITAVESDAEYKHAKVYISVFPQDKEKEILALLKKLSGPIQHELNRTLSMRFVPQLHYVLDNGEHEGYDVESILDELKKETI